MGKDLKGKELGKGISQRKDGYYTARFRNRDGKDVQKYFKKLQDCRKLDCRGKVSGRAWRYLRHAGYDGKCLGGILVGEYKKAKC